MKINEIEKITGLTQKAIRLYEAKGLISVSREENGYRNYTEKDAETLKTIKLLRSIGTPIPDIKLYVFGVISLKELTDKRMCEILKESGRTSEQYLMCERIATDGVSTLAAIEDVFTESEDAKTSTHGAIAVGIDIGTTTVSATVMDIDNDEQLEVYSLPHDSRVSNGIFSEQSVSVILEKAEKLLSHILRCYDGVISIGISGQMHGILYVNTEGEPISELINWQDKRADQPLHSGRSTCEEIFRLTGERVSTGYGIATHYYNLKNGLVPENASGICSIMDAFAMRICGLRKAKTHATVAASFGFFDVSNNNFMVEKLALLGISPDVLPRVTSESETVGEYNGIPVSVAIGDNQASVFGNLRDGSPCLLINIGTGSQVSAVSDFKAVSSPLELRPFVGGRYLICGSALCGGFAYSMLENFFRAYTVSSGAQEKAQYGIMNRLAAEAHEKGEKGLAVDVSFCGKRSDPNCRGSITEIDRESFTPAALTLGVLKGMCEELYELYSAFPEKSTAALASGGAVRKNPLLKTLLEERFAIPVSVNTVDEEAATGAALFSALCINYKKEKRK